MKIKSFPELLVKLAKKKCDKDSVRLSYVGKMDDSDFKVLFDNEVLPKALEAMGPEAVFPNAVYVPPAPEVPPSEVFGLGNKVVMTSHDGDGKLSILEDLSSDSTGPVKALVKRRGDLNSTGDPSQDPFDVMVPQQEDQACDCP